MVPRRHGGALIVSKLKLEGGIFDSSWDVCDSDTCSHGNLGFVGIVEEWLCNVVCSEWIEGGISIIHKNGGYTCC